MKWIGVLALTGAVFASSAMAQDRIRCQSTIGGKCGDSSRPREMNCCDYGYCQPWNSGYYQCIDKPARCTLQETDIDYNGNDLKTIYGLQPDKCCDACADTTGCKGYTFVNENPDGKTACYLKSSTAGRVEKKGAVSGGFAEIPPPANCPVQEVGYDYYGYDIKSLTGVSQGDCCDECGKTSGCAAYTWVERGADGRSFCYLKTSNAGRKVKAGAISGVPKETPPPVDCPAPEYNMDYYGNDIKSLFGVTQGQCCDECGKTPNCVAYTYIPYTATGSTACYLKWSMNGRRGLIGAIGNRRKDPPLTNCPQQETDVDFYGNDIKKIQGLTNGQCCDECGKTAGCAAYTYVVTNDDGRTACYLKSSASGRTTKTGAVSGVVKCATSLMGQCGSSSSGPLCCPDGAFCQPWNPSFYQCIPKPENAKCPTVVTGVDFYGGDLEVKYGLLPSSCCEACYNNNDCHVFTFINFNADGKSACYLKSQLVEQRALAGAVSGYKVKQ